MQQPPDAIKPPPDLRTDVGNIGDVELLLERVSFRSGQLAERLAAVAGVEAQRAALLLATQTFELNLADMARVADLLNEDVDGLAREGAEADR
jgi:hypothetical protein